jgi:hypothetical protein
MSAERLPIAAIAGLGLTQNIGYGTLYYSFDNLPVFNLSDAHISEHPAFFARD